MKKPQFLVRRWGALHTFVNMLNSCRTLQFIGKYKIELVASSKRPRLRFTAKQWLVPSQRYQIPFAWKIKNTQTWSTYWFNTSNWADTISAWPPSRRWCFVLPWWSIHSIKRTCCFLETGATFEWFAGNYLNTLWTWSGLLMTFKSYFNLEGPVLGKSDIDYPIFSFLSYFYAMWSRPCD